MITFFNKGKKQPTSVYYEGTQSPSRHMYVQARIRHQGSDHGDFLPQNCTVCQILVVTFCYALIVFSTARSSFEVFFFFLYACWQNLALWQLVSSKVFSTSNSWCFIHASVFAMHNTRQQNSMKFVFIFVFWRFLANSGKLIPNMTLVFRYHQRLKRKSKKMFSRN